MKNYWSCSKFADWLRGTTKPYSGTVEDWENWDNLARQKSFRYWLAEKGLDHLQDFIFWPANRITDLRYYINNRWITQSHSLVSNLKRGQWHDLDTCLLHSIFDELVNFVEIELAWKLVICSDEDRKKYKTPWYRTLFRINNWRCPEAGIDYLSWASNLKHDEEWLDKNDPNYGKPTSQALAAQEIKNIYTWWKEDRPNAEYLAMSPEARKKKIQQLEKEMYDHAHNLEFEEAARVRDLIKQIQQDTML